LFSALPETASLKASAMDPGLAPGFGGGSERKPPPPGKVERRGGSGRDKLGGWPGALGRGGRGPSLGLAGVEGGGSGAVERRPGGIPGSGAPEASAPGIRPPHSTQNAAPSNPSAPQCGQRADRPAMVTVVPITIERVDGDEICLSPQTRPPALRREPKPLEKRASGQVADGSSGSAETGQPSAAATRSAEQTAASIPAP
jgi:hypothetical protein